jgi:hypothetical protein
VFPILARSEELIVIVTRDYANECKKFYEAPKVIRDGETSFIYTYYPTWEENSLGWMAWPDIPGSRPRREHLRLTNEGNPADPYEKTLKSCFLEALSMLEEMIAIEKRAKEEKAEQKAAIANAARIR